MGNSTRMNEPKSRFKKSTIMNSKVYVDTLDHRQARQSTIKML